MFHAISRVFSTCSAGETPVIAPPESLTAFPSLASSHVTAVNGAAAKEGEVELQSVTTKLDLESMFTIAIDENPARLTIARATLDTYVPPLARGWS